MTNQSNEAQWLFFAPVIVRGENDITNGRPGQNAVLNFTVRSTILDGIDPEKELAAAIADEMHMLFQVAHAFVTEAQDVGGVLVSERDYSIVAQRPDDDSDVLSVGMDGSLFQTKLPHSPVVRASQPEAPAATMPAPAAAAPAPAAQTNTLPAPGAVAAPKPQAQASEILLLVNRFKIDISDGKKKPQFYGHTVPDNTQVERYGAAVSWDLLKEMWPDVFFEPDKDYQIPEGITVVCTRNSKSPQYPSKVLRVATPEEIAAQHPF